MSNVGEAPREAPGHPAHPNRRKSEVAAATRDRRWRGAEAWGAWARKQKLCWFTEIWMVQRKPESLKKKKKKKPTVLKSISPQCQHHVPRREPLPSFLLGPDHWALLPSCGEGWCRNTLFKSTRHAHQVSPQRPPIFMSVCGSPRHKQCQKDKWEGYILERVHQPCRTHNPLVEICGGPLQTRTESRTFMP